MRHNGFAAIDRDVQRKLDEAFESGDPEKIRKAKQHAKETASMCNGSMIGGIIGTIVCPIPVLGTYIGAGIGAFLGYKSAE